MDAVFHALADPSRRLLIDRLGRAPDLTLGQLCEGLPMSRQAVAKHLGVLQGARLLRTTRRGREKLHRLNPAPLDEAAAWIAGRRALWSGVLDNLEAALAVAQPKGSRHD